MPKEKGKESGRSSGHAQLCLKQSKGFIEHEACNNMAVTTRLSCISFFDSIWRTVKVSANSVLFDNCCETVMLYWRKCTENKQKCLKKLNVNNNKFYNGVASSIICSFFSIAATAALVEVCYFSLAWLQLF